LNNEHELPQELRELELWDELEEYKYILFHSMEGKVGRDYLRKRGIKLDTAKFWNLGYCPMNFVPSCISNERINESKKLQGRLIIPIRDQNGKLITISGRSINDEMKPKYIHYKFPARRILYGLYENRSEIRKRNICVITEGQLDVISAWQANFPVVVSSFGAHAGEAHLAIASRYTSNIYFAYDADHAGKNGLDMVKNFKTYGDVNIHLCYNFLPKEEDIDSFLRKHTGKQLYEHIVNCEMNNMNWKLKYEKNMKTETTTLQGIKDKEIRRLQYIEELKKEGKWIEKKKKEPNKNDLIIK
jgi:DNA primase